MDNSIVNIFTVTYVLHDIFRFVQFFSILVGNFKSYTIEKKNDCIYSLYILIIKHNENKIYFYLYLELTEFIFYCHNNFNMI